MHPIGATKLGREGETGEVLVDVTFRGRGP